MNKKTIVLVCATLFGLAACGGGGGGHHTPNVNTGNSQPLNKQGLTNNQTNNKNSSTNQTLPNNQTNNKNTSNNSKPTYTPPSEYKGSVTVSSEPDISKTTIKSITSPNLEKIVVDGHEIVINRPESCLASSPPSATETEKPSSAANNSNTQNLVRMKHLENLENLILKCTHLPSAK